jgi:hypothetical protein
LQHAEHDQNVSPEVVQTTSNGLYAPAGNLSYLPEVVPGSEPTAQNDTHPPQHAAFVEEKHLAPSSAVASAKRLCGMRRGRGIGLFVAIVVIIAIVAGVVGGVLGIEKKTVSFRMLEPGLIDTYYKQHNTTASEPSPSGRPSDTSGSNNTGAVVEATEPIRNIFATQ